MAIVRQFICENCNEPKSEAQSNRHLTNVCAECYSKFNAKTRRQYLAGLKGLTIEERLEKIEAQLYDTNAKSRLDALEHMHATY